MRVEGGSCDQGVYFARGDYAGLFRRFCILLIDGAVAILASIPLSLMFDRLEYLFGCWFLFCWFYFVLLESSPVGTLGFLIARTRIVTIRGTSPSVLRMTFRLLIWVVGPFHILVDLFWLGGDEDRQTLRDKLARTYVIRRDAQWVGSGPIRLKRYLLMGLNLVFYEVQRPSPADRIPIKETSPDPCESGDVGLRR